MLPIYSIHSLGDYNEKGSPVLSTKICMSNKTHRASPFSDNHELLLPKYRNKHSKMRRNVVASLESLAILCTQILDQNLGSLASSLHHRDMLGTTYYTRRNNKVNKNEKKNKIILLLQFNSSLNINYVLPRGEHRNDKRGRRMPSILVFLHQLVVSISTLTIILRLLRCVVFQYNLNNLENKIEKQML